MSLAPIVLFVYNRPRHTEQTLRALTANKLADESDLIIYADGAKTDASPEAIENIKKTREIIKSFSGFKTIDIVESLVNKGLANSIIAGVTDVLNKFGKVIVLEDDLITNPSFLTYMNKSLDVYEQDEAVISIHGYMYPVNKRLTNPFFLKGADCWGWGTWKRGWDLFEPNSELLLNKLEQSNLMREFNFNNSYNHTSLLQRQAAGQIDSWAIRWYASAFLANKLTLYPPISLVQNIGFDGSGTHKDGGNDSAPILSEPINFNFKAVTVTEDKKAKKQIELFLKRDELFFKKVNRKITGLLKKISG